jgi:peptidoglycan/xylan/chitin deacetylase (PgdA/CDA1 family)
VNQLLNSLIRSGALGVTGYARGKSVLLVLTFHRVLAQVDPMHLSWPSAQQFRNRIQWLKKVSNVLPLTDALETVFHLRTPGVFSAVTFDDGYLDNHEIALPILEDEGVAATFFVSTAFLSGGQMFNDTIRQTIRSVNSDQIAFPELNLDYLPLNTIKQRSHAAWRVNQVLKYLPPDERDERALRIAAKYGAQLTDNLMMGESQLIDLTVRGMSVGSHSHRHLIPTTVSEKEFQDDVAQSKSSLESILNSKIDLFAYPNGKPSLDFDQRHIPLLKELGFASAFSTENAAISHRNDLFQLPRFVPWSSNSFKSYIHLCKASRSALTETIG